MNQKTNNGRLSERMEELAYGQLVIVSARWILVLSGLLLTLWSPDPLGRLRLQIVILLLMAVGNFFLHTQALMSRPLLHKVIYASSAADLAVITLLIVTGGGFGSSLYTFYFPAILAFSVVFPTHVTILYTATVTSLYTIISMVSLNDGSAGDVQVLVARLVILVAIAVCGNIFWRVERRRRQAADESHDILMTDFEDRAVDADPIEQRS